MYKVQIKDGNYNKLNFKIESMEEVSMFASIVLATSTDQDIEVDIKEVKENA